MKLLEQNQTYKSKLSDPSDMKKRTMKEDKANIEKEAFDPCHKRTLFVRFPRPVKDKEKVKDLHPGIEAVRFKHRIKRWCHIRFETEEIARRAQKKLHKKKLEHGKLIVMETKKSAINKPLTPKEKLNPHVFKIFVNNLPDEATVKDIELAFPGHKSIRLFKKNKKRKCKMATVMFRTQNELEDIIKSKTPYKVCGTDVAVSYSKSYVTANSTMQGIEKPAVKSKRKKKISLIERAESPASSENENDEVENDDGMSDEMDAKEMTDKDDDDDGGGDDDDNDEDDGGGDDNNEDDGGGDDDEDDGDNDEQDMKGEKNLESENSDCEISDKSDSGNASNDDGGGSNISDDDDDESVMND